MHLRGSHLQILNHFSLSNIVVKIVSGSLLHWSSSLHPKSWFHPPADISSITSSLIYFLPHGFLPLAHNFPPCRYFLEYIWGLKSRHSFVLTNKLKVSWQTLYILSSNCLEWHTVQVKVNLETPAVFIYIFHTVALSNLRLYFAVCLWIHFCFFSIKQGKPHLWIVQIQRYKWFHHWALRKHLHKFRRGSNKKKKVNVCVLK